MAAAAAVLAVGADWRARRYRSFSGQRVDRLVHADQHSRAALARPSLADPGHPGRNRPV